MQISHPNEHGVLPPTAQETLARRGRAYATVRFALCDDGQIRYGLDMMYSHGGFSSPICETSQGYSTLESARTIAIDELLRRWPRPFPSEPASVHQELQKLREQLESHLRQPSLF